MVRSYLRHGGTEAWGVVASSSSNSIYDGKRAYVPALEDVLVWDLKTSTLHSMWHVSGLRSLVTSISRSPADWNVFAVGYADGSVRLWDAKEKEVTVTLNGHKSAVSSLAWSEDGDVLASGSRDTDIILWDVVGEVGLFRLKGHRDQITGLAFVHTTTTEGETTTKKATHLLSGSKDTFLKLWTLGTQHCLDTVVGHRGGIWSLTLDKEAGVVVTGGADGDVKCWKIDPEVLEAGVLPSTSTSTASGLRRALLPLAPLSLPRTNHNHTITQVLLHPTLPVLAVHSGEKTVDVFRLRTEEELRKKLARRRRRDREKKKGKGKEGEDEEAEADEVDGEEKVEWSDRLALWAVVRAGGKIRSFSFAPETSKNKGEIQILTALSSNSLEVHHLPPSLGSKAATPDPVKLHTLDIPGHRTDVRALAVSSDDVLIASAAQGSLKVWNRATTQCVRTIECGYALCVAFLPGDKHIVVGTKSGELLLYDLSSSTLLTTLSAHTGPLWSLSIRPDSRGLVTGSADKDIKFFDFVAAVDAETGAKTLGLEHTKTLKMTDDVLAVKYSPDGRLLAVSLLDSTVKVFYADTLKFFLSLYGHKLPVLALDISSDSKLIVTCSADKNVKIWGLDFGDCHRSLFAHDESVMQVAFERGTHYFWSVGKDKLLKYWDGDKFECIQKLEGHHGEVWALAVSHRGNFVVTGSHDKSIRLWEKTDEPLFLEEERERELEELYDSNVNPREERDALRVTGPDGEEVQGPESTDVTKSTTETLMAGERIIEALEISTQDQDLTKAHQAELAPLSEDARKKVPAPPRNPIFAMFHGAGPQEYVLQVVRRIPAASLHDALLVLPFSKVTQLIEHLDFWAHKEWQITLTSRVLFFLLRTHHSQIVATRALRTTMISLRANLREALRRQKDSIGYNLAALRFIQRQHDAAKSAEFYESGGGMVEEDKVREKIAQGIKKRKRAALLS